MEGGANQKRELREVAARIAREPDGCSGVRAATPFYFTSSALQKLLSNRSAEHFRGILLCASDNISRAPQGQNYPRPTDIARSPPTHLPNRGCDNSKSWSTTSCAIPESGR